MRTGFAAVQEAIERAKVERAKAERYTSRTPTKVYEIYPRGLGFSVKTVDYHGTAMMVAATSARRPAWAGHCKVAPAAATPGIRCMGSGASPAPASNCFQPANTTA